MSNTNPKISVIMSVYNCKKYLNEAVLSILNQTFRDFEFIIINDGSTDGSKEILESYKDDRIRLFNNQNKGLTKSLNEAIGYAKGELIARIDADDISLPQRFEKQILFLNNHPEISMCGAWAEFIDENGKVTGEYRTPVSSSEIKRGLLKHNPFIHSTVMIRKNVFEKVGLYNESFRHVQDYELWTRVVTKLQTANLPEILLKYRILQESITKSNRASVKISGFKIRCMGIWRLLFN